MITEIFTQLASPALLNVQRLAMTPSADPNRLLAFPAFLSSLSSLLASGDPVQGINSGF